MSVNSDTGIESIKLIFNSNKAKVKDQYKAIEKAQIRQDLQSFFTRDEVEDLLKEAVNPRNSSMNWYVTDKF